MAAPTMERRFMPFGGLPSDISTDRAEYQIIEPIASVTSGNTVEFQISASQAGMIDWSQSYLLSRLTMVQTTDWEAVAAEAATAAVEATATPAQRAVDADAAMAAPRSIWAFEENEAPEECFSAAMWSSCELYINCSSNKDMPLMELVSAVNNLSFPA